MDIIAGRISMMFADFNLRPAACQSGHGAPFGNIPYRPEFALPGLADHGWGWNKRVQSRCVGWPCRPGWNRFV